MTIPAGLVIYALLEPGTGAVRYVGKAGSLKSRLQQHPYRKDNQRLSKWLLSLRALGAELSWEILERPDSTQWRAREKYWIAHYRALGADLFNIADGGDGMEHHSEQVRQYLSRIRKSRTMAPEHKRAFFLGGQAAAQTPESRAKRIASLTGRPSALKGKSIHSEESRMRISEAHKGKPKSLETRAKLSAANMGHRDSPEVRAKKSASHIGLPGPNRGRTFGMEVRTKMSLARRGKGDREFGNKMREILTGRPKSPEQRRKISERMQGWMPTASMLERSLVTRNRLMQNDPVFRERALSGLRNSWNDPEIKRRRAEGNRRRLLPAWEEYRRWLNTDPLTRIPKTQAAFQREFGVSEGTLTKWRREIINANP